MNFFSKKPNIRNTKSEVIHKSNNNSASIDNVSCNIVNEHNANSNNEGENDTNNINFLPEDSNGFANSNYDIDKRSEIYHCNKVYDAQYSMHMNKIQNGVRSTRNYTSSHRICSPRSQSINLFAPKVNRTSTISRNFDDKLSQISFYTNKKKHMDRISILESNDSFKTQGNSPIVEQSLELLKHLVNQENREHYMSSHETDNKNKLMLKLIDQTKKNEEKTNFLPTEYSSNKSYDNYQKRFEMLHFKFIRLKNDYSHLSNENVILKKQLRNIKDNYHMLNPKSATVSFPRGSIREDMLRSNDIGKSSDTTNINNEINMKQQQGEGTMLNKGTNINKVIQSIDNLVAKTKLVDCEVQTDCTLASHTPNSLDHTTGGDGNSILNVNRNNLNSNVVDEEYLNRIREQIRNEVTLEITNKLEKKYKDELHLLRQGVANNNKIKQSDSENISIDKIFNKTRAKLDEEINKTINSYKNNIFVHFKELVNLSKEGSKNSIEMNYNEEGNTNKRTDIGVNNFSSLSYNEKINECMSLLEKVIKMKKNIKKENVKKNIDSSSLINVLNNINTDINDIDDMIYNLSANIARSHISDDGESYPEELDILEKPVTANNYFELEEVPSCNNLDNAVDTVNAADTVAATDTSNENEMMGEPIIITNDKGEISRKNKKKFVDHNNDPITIHNDGAIPNFKEQDDNLENHPNRGNMHMENRKTDDKIDVMGNISQWIVHNEEKLTRNEDEYSSVVSNKNMNTHLPTNGHVLIGSRTINGKNIDMDRGVSNGPYNNMDSSISNGTYNNMDKGMNRTNVNQFTAGVGKCDKNHAIVEERKSQDSLDITSDNVARIMEGNVNNEKVHDKREKFINFVSKDNAVQVNSREELSKEEGKEIIHTEQVINENKDNIENENGKKKSKWKSIFSSKKTKKKNLSDNFGNDTELWSKNENNENNENNEKNNKNNTNGEKFYNIMNMNTSSNNVQIEKGEIDVLNNDVNNLENFKTQNEYLNGISNNPNPHYQEFIYSSKDHNIEKVHSNAYNLSNGGIEFYREERNETMNNGLQNFCNKNDFNNNRNDGNNSNTTTNYFIDGEKCNHNGINAYDGSRRTQINPFNYENNNNPVVSNNYNVSNADNLHMYKRNSGSKNLSNYNDRENNSINCSIYSYNPNVNSKKGFVITDEEGTEKESPYTVKSNSIKMMNNNEQVGPNNNFPFMENNKKDFVKLERTYQNNEIEKCFNFYKNDVHNRKINNGMNTVEELNNQYNFFYSLNDSNGPKEKYNPCDQSNNMTCLNKYNNEYQFDDSSEKNRPNYYSKTANIKRVNSSAVNTSKNHTTDLTQNGQVKLSTKSEVHYNSIKVQKNKTKKNLEDLFA
ncbi:hypothetical protein, conserved [Plasmodium gonderi]|uniref:Uncharacterized protein n=1 Tax=Plasmodium gonderi TaxID=77519 RepID=A0A1Y1JLT9_PLAGO|nr:hypothetical protein, conserved [Plasmodium gonderi]GAW83431.1 hypothetical protein, conserved [Plasmodium gonderi]